MCRFITIDQTLVYPYKPKKKLQSKQGPQWFFCLLQKTSIIFIDYLPKGRTITGEYYESFFDKLKQKVNEKRPGLDKKIVRENGA